MGNSQLCKEPGDGEDILNCVSVRHRTALENRFGILDAFHEYLAVVVAELSLDEIVLVLRDFGMIPATRRQEPFRAHREHGLLPIKIWHLLHLQRAALLPPRIPVQPVYLKVSLSALK